VFAEAVAQRGRYGVPARDAEHVQLQPVEAHARIVPTPEPLGVDPAVVRPVGALAVERHIMAAPARTHGGDVNSKVSHPTPSHRTRRREGARVALIESVSFEMKFAAGTAIRNLLVFMSDTTDGTRRRARSANPDVENMLSKEPRPT